MVRGEIELGPCLFSLALLNRTETHKTLGFWGLSVRVLYYHPSRWSLWIVSLLILFCVKKFHWDAIHPTFVLHFTKCIATYRSVPTSSGLWNSPITTHSGGPFEWLEPFIFFFAFWWLLRFILLRMRREWLHSSFSSIAHLCIAKAADTSLCLISSVGFQHTLQPHVRAEMGASRTLSRTLSALKHLEAACLSVLRAGVFCKILFGNVFFCWNLFWKPLTLRWSLKGNIVLSFLLYNFCYYTHWIL